MAPYGRSSIVNCLKQIIDIAIQLQSDPRHADRGSELERAAIEALDAIIFELSDRERQIFELRESLRKERSRRPAREPRWSRLDELQAP